MANMELKILSSMEKCFLDESIAGKTQLEKISMLRNERLSLQAAYTTEDPSGKPKAMCRWHIESPLADAITVSKVDSLPVQMPVYPEFPNENYLRTEPGMYPDLLTPITESQQLMVAYKQLQTLMITIENEEGLAPGTYPLEFTVTWGEEVFSTSIEITVIDAMLPEQTLMHTQWFHNDCLATWYECEVFSERHWEIVGNYMKAARRCGINMILTPVFTPPLDTAVGHERPTVQLVDVIKNGDAYTFGFDKLDRYVKLAQDCGMKYFEIAHFFTQWGAKHAPKVVAAVDGEVKKIFGWETDAAGEEYGCFIRSFLTALLAHLKELGIDKKCWFHISDEPTIEHLESYVAAKAQVADLLKDYKTMDALSHYDYYESGLVETPIPATNAIGPFLENKVPELWTYYCCGQHQNTSNRFLSMPGQRTRILGVQLYKFAIVGFLQWGFNFWYSQYSLHKLNPFVDTCGDYFVPAGDTCSVYPGPDGKAMESLHALQFYEGLQDMRALQLLEAKIGRDAVLALIEEACTEPLTFVKYPTGQDYLLGLREKINSLLA